VTKSIELRRHTESDGDVLTAKGVLDAVRIGGKLHGPYDLVVSSGAQRATQTAACLLAGMAKPVAGGVVIDEGFRSEREARWREIYAGAKKKGDLEAFLLVDYPFVESEARRFVAALRRVEAHTTEGGRSLVVGHSPMLEATVWGGTGDTIKALAKGSGVTLVFEDGVFTLAE
jgi:broad specificity phosphatase PhoE